jgi:hypothetical protein
MDPRLLERNASRVEALKSSAKALRQEVRALRDAMQDLTAQLSAAQLQLDQLTALRLADQDASARMDALEHVLGMQRVSAHLRTALERAAIVEEPVPHLVVTDALPVDMYCALLDAIPSDIFFDGKDTTWRELLVPPRLAPTSSIATWTFLADLVRHMLGPMVLGRFQQRLDAHLAAIGSPAATVIAPVASQGRIVLRWPGYESGRRSRPWDFLTVILWLARPGDGEEFGSRVRGVGLPFRANSLLVVFDPSGAHEYSPIPPRAAAAVRRYSFEFRIGLDTAGRRSVLAVMDEGTRREWETFDR